MLMRVVFVLTRVIFVLKRVLFVLTRVLLVLTQVVLVVRRVLLVLTRALLVLTRVVFCHILQVRLRPVFGSGIFSHILFTTPTFSHYFIYLGKCRRNDRIPRRPKEIMIYRLTIRGVPDLLFFASGQI